MLKYMPLASNMIVTAFFAIGAIYFYKQRRFENEKRHSAIKLMVFALLLVSFTFFLTLLQNIDTLFLHTNFTRQINYIGEFVLLPLSGVFFIISMIFLKKPK